MCVYIVYIYIYVCILYKLIILKWICLKRRWREMSWSLEVNPKHVGDTYELMQVITVPHLLMYLYYI